MSVTLTSAMTPPPPPQQTVAIVSPIDAVTTALKTVGSVVKWVTGQVTTDMDGRASAVVSAKGSWSGNH